MYTINIRLEKSKDVLQLMESLPKGTWIQIAPIEERKQNTPMVGGQFLTMTGKKAQPGSMREKVLTAFEKLEKKHEIGNVTRTMLRDYCNTHKLDSQIIYQLTHDGYLRAL